MKGEDNSAWRSRIDYFTLLSVRAIMVHCFWLRKSSLCWPSSVALLLPAVRYIISVYDISFANRDRESRDDALAKCVSTSNTHLKIVVVHIKLYFSSLPPNSSRFAAAGSYYRTVMSAMKFPSCRENTLFTGKSIDEIRNKKIWGIFH